MNVDDKAITSFYDLQSRLYELQPGDILVHDNYGDFTILEHDPENLGYIVYFDDYKQIIQKCFLPYYQILNNCKIKQ